MINCAKCGRANEDHFKFCLGCGSNLDEQRAAAKPAPVAVVQNCPQCGTPVSQGQRFCGSCGFNIESYVPPAAPPAAPPPAAPPAGPPSPTPSNGVGAYSQGAPAAAPAQAWTAPASSTPTVGQLVKINPDGSPGESHALVPGENIVGRTSPNPLFSADEFLSPQHASFTVQGGAARIVDLRSENGVYYRISEPTALQHGDMIRIGQELLRFELLAQAERLLAPSPDGTVVSGSPPSGAWGRLERVSAPGEASFTFLLRGAETFIGRERGDILFRDDGYVSGKHARVFTDGQRYFLEDLKSSNGSFIRVRGEITVPSGTLILMGKQPFRVQLS